MPLTELGADNPFSDRPSTAQQLMINDAEAESSVQELDDFSSNAPSGCDRATWERFVSFRGQKISMENILRMKALTLIEMNLYLQKRIEEDEQNKKEIDENIKVSMT